MKKLILGVALVLGTAFSVNAQTPTKKSETKHKTETMPMKDHVCTAACTKEGKCVTTCGEKGHTCSADCKKSDMKSGACSHASEKGHKCTEACKKPM